jgi:hypothetical protein
VDELRQELQQDEVAENLDTAERLLEQCAQHRTSCLEACASTIAQGEALLQELRDSTEMPDTTGSVSTQTLRIPRAFSIKLAGFVLHWPAPSALDSIKIIFIPPEILLLYCKFILTF